MIEDLHLVRERTLKQRCPPWHRSDRPLGIAAADPIRYTVAIIGAGFGGIGMAIRLKLAGWHDFIILEQADTVGGVWRDNTYPNSACTFRHIFIRYRLHPASTGHDDTRPRWKSRGI